MNVNQMIAKRWEKRLDGLGKEIADRIVSRIIHRVTHRNPYAYAGAKLDFHSHVPRWAAKHVVKKLKGKGVDAFIKSTTTHCGKYGGYLVCVPFPKVEAPKAKRRRL